MEKVTLKIPGNPEFLHVLRSVISSIGARESLSIDELHDLQLVVDEAGAYLLKQDLGAPHIWLSVWRLEGGIKAAIWVEASVDEWPQDRADDSLPWMVMKALTDSVEFVTQDGWPGIEFTKDARGVGADGG